MISKLKIPNSVPITIKWITKLWLIYLLIFTILRVATVVLFIPEKTSAVSLIPSFVLGFKYDAKWISIILLPIAVLSAIPRFSPFHSEKNKKWWSFYLAFTTLLVLFFFAADFGNFSYNHGLCFAVSIKVLKQ